MTWHTRALVIAAAAAALGVAACGDDDSSDSGDSDTDAAATSETQPGAAETTTAAADPAGTRIVATDSEFGRILFDSDDQAIYLFDKESGPRSECYGECAEAWPPVLTKGAPAAAAGVDQALLGTTKREDGSTQVTYNGHPLYYYVDDPKGEVLCHDVQEFGGGWFVVQPNGDRAA